MDHAPRSDHPQALPHTALDQVRLPEPQAHNRNHNSAVIITNLQRVSQRSPSGGEAIVLRLEDRETAEKTITHML